MRIARWSIAFLFPLASVAIVVFLLRSKSLPITTPKLSVSDILNIGLIVVALVSLYIAVAAFVYARASGERQQAILDASRRSLEAVVARAEIQQELLKQNLETSKIQLEVVQEQWKQQEERLARRANFELVALNDQPWERIAQQDGNVQLAMRQEGWARLTLLYRNPGKIALERPIYIFSATPDTVFLDQEDFHLEGRANHNLYQIGGPNTPNVLPITQSGVYRISVDVTVPRNVPKFDLLFKVIGDNMDGAREFVFHFLVVFPDPLGNAPSH